MVAAQLRRAEELGARQIRAVATAAIRRAANSAALADAVEACCGLKLEILSGEEEARLAFVGACNALLTARARDLGGRRRGRRVVRAGCGAGAGSGRLERVVRLGSSDLTEEFLASDPPALAEVAAARSYLAGTFGGLEVPTPAKAVAVGGSATSLGRVAGRLLDAPAFRRALLLLGSDSASEVARRFELAAERVRLLPAGLLILESVSQRFDRPLIVGGGGVREAVLLEACCG